MSGSRPKKWAHKETEPPESQPSAHSHTVVLQELSLEELEKVQISYVS